MKQNKLRPMGDILLDLEILLQEMTDENQHGMQYGDVLSLIFSWLEIHAPHAKEEYIDGGHPEFFYGYKKHD